MSEALGLAAASAVAAQALFGESGGGIASRLHTALGGELSRARAEAAFSGAAGVGVGLVPDARLQAGPAASGRRFAALDAGAAERTRDARVRGDAREGRGGGGGDGGETDRDDDAESDAGGNGVGAGGTAREEGGSARVHGIDERELAAVRTALASVRAAAIDIGCDGALRAVVLSGAALSVRAGERAPCRLLILCFAPDGALGDTRHVWGFGYEEDTLVLTLDARREVEGTGGASEAVADERSTVGGVPARWRVRREGRGAAAGGGDGTVRCEHVGGSHTGIVVTPDTGSPPGTGWEGEGWTLLVQDCSPVPVR